jgi:hypothetical protein
MMILGYFEEGEYPSMHLKNGYSVSLRGFWWAVHRGFQNSTRMPAHSIILLRFSTRRVSTTSLRGFRIAELAEETLTDEIGTDEVCEVATEWLDCVAVGVMTVVEVVDTVGVAVNVDVVVPGTVGAGEVSIEILVVVPVSGPVGGRITLGREDGGSSVASEVT